METITSDEQCHKKLEAVTLAVQAGKTLLLRKTFPRVLIKSRKKYDSCVVMILMKTFVQIGEMTGTRQTVNNNDARLSEN